MTQSAASIQSVACVSAVPTQCCCVCSLPAQSHSCSKCKRICHPFCGTAVNEGYGASVICSLCSEKGYTAEPTATTCVICSFPVDKPSNCDLCSKPSHESCGTVGETSRRLACTKCVNDTIDFRTFSDQSKPHPNQKRRRQRRI